MGPFGSNIKAENFVAEGVPVIRGTNLNYSRYVDGNFVYPPDMEILATETVLKQAELIAAELTG